MQDAIALALVDRIRSAHRWLIDATTALPEETLFRRFGPTAPPIGWHLWHISRWADRVQASLPRSSDAEGYRPNPNAGIWERESMAAEWDLDPRTLGTLEEGSGMTHEDAAALPRTIGKPALVDYATRVFAAFDAGLDELTDDAMRATRTSVMEYEIREGKVYKAPGKETTLAADLGFHLSHANRHLGMIEALRGLADQEGTITA